MITDLTTLVAERSVIVCCGPGGVGKTSIAAALGVAAASAGRATCVVTVDPARRLADALGIELEPNVAHEVTGPWRGRLDAVMLDAAGTFDELVARYAASPEQIERISSNRLYRNLIGNLSGTQEYMATERLFALHTTGDYELIIVDTPPSRHAVDFLSAPSRLTGFLDNRLFRLLVKPGRVTARAVGVASQLLLRTIARVAGGEIVEDTIAFFQAFEGMEQGFRERASAVEALLGAGSTAYVLVTTARRDALSESAWLADAVGKEGHLLDAIVVNRMLPFLDDPWLDLEGIDLASTPSLEPHLRNARALGSLASAEQQLVDDFVTARSPDALALVPQLDGDVHDLGALSELARHFGPAELP